MFHELPCLIMHDLYLENLNIIIKFYIILNEYLYIFVCIFDWRIHPIYRPVQYAASDSVGLWVISLFKHQNENNVAPFVGYPINTFWCYTFENFTQNAIDSENKMLWEGLFNVTLYTITNHSWQGFHAVSKISTKVYFVIFFQIYQIL